MLKVRANVNGLVTVMVILLPVYRMVPCVIPAQLATGVALGVGESVGVGEGVALGIGVRVEVGAGVGVTSSTSCPTGGAVLPW